MQHEEEVEGLYEHHVPVIFPDGGVSFLLNSPSTLQSSKTRALPWCSFFILTRQEDIHHMCVIYRNTHCRGCRVFLLSSSIKQLVIHSVAQEHYCRSKEEGQCMQLSLLLF